VFTDPIKNLKALGLRKNNIVADLGAGTGYYSIFAGALVPEGKVYAVEIDRNFLDTIKHKAKEARLHNVEIIWGNVEKKGGTKIGDRAVDAVVASNVLFQLEQKDNFLEEIKRILKPYGKVLFIDWRAESVLKNDLIVPKEKALRAFKEKGFELETEIDAGDHHYGIILRKIP
jgi:ubiquinone/menaquinone biosynthesis C-methylase UbiE